MFIIVKCEIYKLEMESEQVFHYFAQSLYRVVCVRDAIDRSVETAVRRNSPIVTEK
ncbi:hypothetical protein ROZALSC1DRAFT_29935, partial [Rozella allomycis CSF55]